MVDTKGGFYRFINTTVPTDGCNLRCEYCYVKQRGDEDLLEIEAGKQRFRYSIEHMMLALSVERMGGICMFNIAGSGETLLCPDIVQITEGLLANGHFVALITNLTIRSRVTELCLLPQEYRDRLFFKVSFHYRELKRRNMLDSFAENVHMLKNHGISFSVEIVASDYALDDVDEIKSFSLAMFGAMPHVLTGRDEHTDRKTFKRSSSRLSQEEYDRVWSSFDSGLFEYQQHAYDIPHREFCYAGVYTGTLMLDSGNFSPCPGTRKVTNFFENIDEPILFAPVGRACPFPSCFCGFFLHVLAGVSRGYDPGVWFYNFRDRDCEDGSHWLTPSIREAFSHRCSEYHQPYSADKELFLDAFMRTAYQQLEPVQTPEERTELALIVGRALRGKGWNKIAIYGMGAAGKWLKGICELAGIEVAYGIDRRFTDIQSDCPILSPDAALPEVNAIIVTAYGDFTYIAPNLRKKIDAPVVSIVTLID